MSTSAPEGDVERLSGRQLGVRMAAVVIVLVTTLAGTFVGQDADFPFGPFRMYASRNAPDGVVSSLRLEGVDTSGQRFAVPAGSVGLRRADLEGTLPDLRTRPALMADLARRWDANHPAAAPLRQLDVILRQTKLKDGLETKDYSDSTVVTWIRS